MNIQQFMSEETKKTEEAIAGLESLRIRNSLVSHGFVVFNPAAGMPLEFTWEALPNGRKRATAGRCTALRNAPQFTRKDAETLARECKNGHGATCEALFINDAIDRMQAAMREHLARLPELMAKIAG